MDSNLTDLIDKWNAKGDKLQSSGSCADLSQRIHDAGYRKVPSVAQIQAIIQNDVEHCLQIDEYGPDAISSISAQAIHDLMMGGE